jgi:hypothetical protein
MSKFLTLIAVGIMFTASGSAQGQHNSTEQYFNAKHGRSSPREDARQKAAQANTAWREEQSTYVPWRSDTLAEQAFRAKHGRSSPREEARQKAAQANTAWREDPSPGEEVHGDTLAEQYFKAKFGRSSPREEARQKAAKTNRQSR